MKNELAYRRLQRELGEIHVALKLTVDLHKAMPGVPELAKAVRAMIAVKAMLMNQVRAMED